MKIKIELEVEQDEIPLVTELVSLLRQFKATVPVVTPRGATTASSAAQHPATSATASALAASIATAAAALPTPTVVIAPVQEK
jgi:hypothetical protein